MAKSQLMLNCFKCKTRLRRYRLSTQYALHKAPILKSGKVGFCPNDACHIWYIPTNLNDLTFFLLKENSEYPKIFHTRQEVIRFLKQ